MFVRLSNLYMCKVMCKYVWPKVSASLQLQRIRSRGFRWQESSTEDAAGAGPLQVELQAGAPLNEGRAERESYCLLCLRFGSIQLHIRKVTDFGLSFQQVVGYFCSLNHESWELRVNLTRIHVSILWLLPAQPWSSKQIQLELELAQN